MTPPHPRPTARLFLCVLRQMDMKAKMRAFCDSRSRPFHATYDPYSRTVSVDRAIVRKPYDAGTSAY